MICAAPCGWPALLATGRADPLPGAKRAVLAGAYWDFWDHYLPLTERSLGEALELLGFGIEESVPRFLPYSMVGKRPAPLALVRWYLKLPWAWRFFGRQFLVVGRVPGATGK